MTDFSDSPPESNTDRLTHPEFRRRLLARRLTYVMLLRVILFTLILGGTVGVNLAWGTPEELGGPYVRVLFIFISAIYIINIGCAVLMRYLSRLRSLAVFQLTIDLMTSALLVHFTGGAESAFALLFLLTPIAAAVTLGRKASLVACLTSIGVFMLVSLLGYGQVLPPLPGQIRLPGDTAPGALGRSLLVNTSALAAIALLAGYLAEQVRSASEQVELQQAHIDDLATLNVDIIRCLTSGLITVNERGRVLSINRAAREILGLPQGQPAGRPLQDMCPALSQAVFEADATRRTELELDRGGRQLLLGISVSPLTDHLNQLRGRIVNFQDLTGIREMEATVRQSEHLASLGRMAAGIAHEIRNPLASISGSLELLHDEHGIGEDSRQLMGIATREIERLNQLITSFLDYARPHEPALRLMNLGQEMHRLAEGMTDPDRDFGCPDIDVSQGDQELWVEADRGQLRAVLWNLVRNAREAGAPTQVRIHLHADGSSAVLEVQDRGKGIPREVINHVFEPFFTTKEQGTGLGLATVYRIVQEHRGTIKVQTSDEGSTFSVLLPLVPPPAPELNQTRDT